MAEHRETRYQRLYLKEPGTDRIRKEAAGGLAHKLSTGWHESERWHSEHYITVKLERSGVDPALGTLPPIPPPAPRSRSDRDRRPGGPRG